MLSISLNFHVEKGMEKIHLFICSEFVGSPTSHSRDQSNVSFFDQSNRTVGIDRIHKKKIDKSIDFLRGWEEKMVSIFCLGSCEKVGLSPGPNGAGYETHRVPSYNLNTPS